MSETALKIIGDKVAELKYGDAFLIHTETYSNNKGKTYTINIPMLRSYLKREGFRNFKESPVLVTGNIVKKVAPDDIFKYTLEYIETFDDSGLEAAFMKQGESIILKNKAIILGLPECEKELLRDSEFISYHFYKNGILKIEKDKESQLIPYEKSQGLVWENQIIERSFVITETEESKKAMFRKFIQNVSIDEEHYKSICNAIGYMLHKYKDPRKPICIILTDLNITNNGKAEGRTGKGLFVKAIGKILNVALLNGKNSSFRNNKFAYSVVDLFTNLVFIDDVLRGFDFEDLFSSLTDALTVEKKFQHPVILDYKVSPKITLSSNYPIKGSSSSHKARSHEIHFSNHYSSKWTPNDDFKCEFFHGWSESEWLLFDAFMMSCLKLYLEEGLIEYENNEDLKLKKLIGQTNEFFYELMEEKYSDKGTKYGYDVIRQETGERGGTKVDSYLKGNHKIIVDWIKLYGEYKGFEIITKKPSGKYIRATGAGNAFIWEMTELDHENIGEIVDELEF